ncbi:protein Pry1p [[Candida] railenensis]|uniref:Protein Pry1p n=1 Tax=[Candida] railenensis TaxID=45579 RepID=A0A9P0QT13_9ASCO|nr:protein Pry1p [[Candida] railenensis]
MKFSISIAALMAVAAALPAPVVTVVQVTTEVVNEDGSLYTSTPVVASAAPAAATTAAAAAASSSSSSGSGLLSWLKGVLGDYLDGDDEASATTPAVAAAAATTSSAIAYAALLESTSSSPVAYAATSAASVAAQSTSAATVATSQATSTSSSSDLYADIYKSSGIDETFAKDILDAHNEKRALHSAPDLSWDLDAYNYAQNYADAYDCSGVLTHSHGPYGENLAAGFKDGPSALEAWYEEGATYNYAAGNTYDHFTQVVWKDTTKVGCAYKDCSSNNWGLYIICSYDPAGNVVGESAANVLAT